MMVAWFIFLELPMFGVFGFKGLRSGVLACRIFGVCKDVRFQGLALGFRKFGGQAWNSQRYPIFWGGQIIVLWTQGATT